MSLLTGARDLANRSGQECTVWHVFWAALPPYAYPPYSYPDDATRRALETIPHQTRESWAQALQAMLTKALPGQGQPSRELADALVVAQDRADRSRRPLTDGILLATIIERENTIQGIILASREDYRGLIRKLDDQSLPLGTPTNPPASAMPPAQSPEDRERELASRALNDCLSVTDPSSDLHFKTLQTVEMNTFLTTLAEATKNRSTVVCVGQDGSLISLVESILADRLASGIPFSGKQAPLSGYNGKLYKIEVETLSSLTETRGGPKPATVLKLAKEKLGAMEDKPILLLDHLEKIQGDSQEMNDLRFEIGERGKVLVFGIYHAPDQHDYLNAARLGRDNMKPLQFKAYTLEQTKTLINDFFIKLWRSQGQGFNFAKGAFGTVIDLQPGAWHDQKRKVLPGLVIDLTQDAMDTASRGEGALKETVGCALQAFEELRQKELPETAHRKKFEPLLKKAEEEVRQLLADPPRKGGFLGLFSSPPEPRLDPNKPIEITSAHIVAELICHNVSEFHYPDPKFDPVPRA